MMSSAVEAKIIRKNDIQYKGSSSRAHRLDLYYPPARKNLPLLVFIHGGAWVTGDKDIWSKLATRWAELGYAVAVVNYRLSLSPGLIHPVHSQDVAAACGWLVEHQNDHPYSPTKTVLIGHSAGAHIAAFLASHPSMLSEEGVSGPFAPKGAIGIGGIYDIKAFAKSFPRYERNYVLKAFPNPEKWDEASPSKQKVSVRFPWAVIHSKNDEAVNIAQAKQFHEHLKSQGIESELMIFDRYSHTGIMDHLGDQKDKVTLRIQAFLKNIL